jgi:hypothetical protein
MTPGTFVIEPRRRADPRAHDRDARAAGRRRASRLTDAAWAREEARPPRSKPCRRGRAVAGGRRARSRDQERLLAEAARLARAADQFWVDGARRDRDRGLSVVHGLGPRR